MNRESLHVPPQYAQRGGRCFFGSQAGHLRLERSKNWMLAALVLTSSWRVPSRCKPFDQMMEDLTAEEVVAGITLCVIPGSNHYL